MAYQNTIEKLGWSSAKFITSFGTFSVEDISAVSWTDKQEKQLIYGAGSAPIGYGLGKESAEASITLLLDYVLPLTKAAPGGKLTKIPSFDFIMQFRAEGSTVVQTVKLKNCQFLENKASIKSGDMSVEQELPLLCSGVEVI